MFLEKYSRFVKRYTFSFRPRHGLAATLPLLTVGELPSIEDALREAMQKGTAEVREPNGDTVSLVKCDRYHDDSLVLLFHRDRPEAPDPTYRRIENGARVLRNGQKDEDEEQTYSAHLVMTPDPILQNHYRCALEEIPGLSASAVVKLMRLILNEYEYDYTDKRGDAQKTHSFLRYEGMKSASFEEALENGVLNIKLSRPTGVDFLDAEGLVQPGRDTATLKLVAKLDSKTIMEKLLAWKEKATQNGWTEFSVDVEVGHNRQKTVKIENQEEVADILFVRSDLIKLETAMAAAQDEIVPEFVDRCIELLKA